MSKVRVYELAKEMNTTSKRLMEKLAEINIIVKNHMSLLEDHELEALYRHIGVIKHGEGKKAEPEERKAVATAPPPRPEVKKDTKSAPRIIRTTEIFIDSKGEARDMKAPVRPEQVRNDRRMDNNRGNGGNMRGGGQKPDLIRIEDSNSGLRPGFTRDNRQDYRREVKPFAKTDAAAKPPVKEFVKEEVKQEAKPEIKPESRQEIRPEPKQEVKFESKPEANTEIKAEMKVEAKPEMKVEIKPEVRQDVRPEAKPEVKVSEPVASRSEDSVPAPRRDADRSQGGPAEARSEAGEGKQESPKAEPRTEKKPADNEEAGKTTEQARSGQRGDFVNNPAARNDQHQGDRPPFQRNQGPRGNDGDFGGRQQGDRPQGGNFRGPNDRPQGGGYGNRQGGYNDRPQGGNYRGNEDRPQGNNFRGPGDRPQGGNFRGPNDRPQGGNYGGSGDRPQGNNFRGPNDRPQGGGYGNRQGGYNDRPQGGNFRGPGDRPQGGNYGGSGDRPQGGGYGNRPGGYNDRPQGGNFRGPGDRPQGGNFRGPGDRPQGGNFRGPGDRPQGGGYGNRPGGPRGGGNRGLEIPKPELSAVQKEEMSTQRNSEIRREFQNKDTDKDIKREQKRDIPKGQQAAAEKRFKPQKVGLGEKKEVSEVLSEEFILDAFYTDDGLKAKKAFKPKKAGREEFEKKHIPHRAVLTSVKLHETVTVKELAETLKKTSTDVIKKLMGMGLMVTLNHELDFDTAAIIADEFGVKAEREVVVNEEDILFDDTEDNAEELQPRPPVVVVMGHVDHGKTSLLDAVRETNVIDSEAGGITQHIGACTVKINHRNITFLDTPGHEAFTAMRARGAQVTDIAILVVAADDGVMPQTIEAINHAKAANVSIIVAINKIDKPGANPDRVKQELTEYGLVSEEWGGETICVPVSAKKRMNIDHLLEMVLLVADMLELKANPHRQAKGTVIEAKLDKGRGPVATMLVQRGTLNVSDSIVTGTTVGRIRAMVDDKGHKLKKAGPSTPVEIIGLPEVPEAGEIFYAITDERVAKQLAEKRKLKQREQQLKASAKVSLEDLFTQIKEGKVKDLNIIVKADVQGSVEAVKQSLEKLSNDEVRVRIVHGGVGAITESDVTLANVSNAIIIGFNVRPGTNVMEAAKNAGVDMRLYRVIYNAIEDIQAAMKGMLEPTFKEVVQGHTEIRQIFKVSGVGTIGGCYVLDGKIVRNSEVRVVRNGIVIHEGKLASLKRFKDDAKEVMQGFECGLSIEKFNDIKEGDIVESFVMEEVAR